ncbi:MAG: hypothetical protein JJU16_10115 [Alkalibacterium sp.]|nr:hypothetical protein [Alkalibacterium sp.]
MIVKWTRESLLVLLTLVMILVAGFYYGNRLFLDPVRVTADASSQVVNEQERLLSTYPPSDALRQELMESYESTTLFIPDGERINEATVMIEQLAEDNDVALGQMTRLSDNQPVEGLSERFLKSTYQIEFISPSAEGLRSMLNDLSREDRLWDSQVFSYQRETDDEFSGSLIIDLYYHIPSSN